MYEQSLDEADATFLSGNGPLVRVLQDALESRVFVRDLHAYVRSHGINRTQPKQHIVVFDEAQRAWDSEYMNVKKNVDRSEADLLLAAAARLPDWCLFVGLVGEGQEIHSGEEGGLEEWRRAIQSTEVEWEIHCPERLQGEFIDIQVHTNDDLDLTISLRSRQAGDLHDWVQLILAGSPELARHTSTRVKRGFVAYLSRDLTGIQTYLSERYAGDANARFGLVSSSHAKILPKYGVDNTWTSTSRMKIEKWFNADPADPLSACQLEQPVTEFGCQGLELDIPVVAWGEDLRWDRGSWSYSPVRRRFPLHDPAGIVTNVYRVLLTRGRDGVIALCSSGPPA